MSSDLHDGPPTGGITATMSHYLGELYRLGAQRQVVSPSSLAQEMDVSVPSAARMIERLEKAGLVEREPYKGVRLTSAGERRALREIRAHRLSESFLVRVLGYGWHEAHDTADALAEIADEVLVSKMDRAAGHPTRCPHGEPIPSAEGIMPQVLDTPLTELPIGFRGRVSRVRVRDESRLVYLAKIGLVPEQPIEVVNRGPFDGPIRVRVDAKEEVLGAELAALIRVEAA